MTRTLVRLLTVGLALAGALVPFDGRLVERWYSSGAYPYVQHLLTPAANLVPFAWLDGLVAVALAIVCVSMVLAVRRARQGRTLVPIASLVGGLLVWGAALYLAFLALWGLNYQRIPMADRIQLDGSPPSGEAVLALGQNAARQLNALHQQAHEAGWRTAPWRERSLRESFASVLGDLSDAPPAVPGRLKASLLGPYFRWAGVDGMINPFGLESIANPDLLPFEQPFVAAHEWAHLAGYANESEASFVGWLACARADAPSAYSGWLFLYWQVRSEAGRAQRTQLADALGPGPLADVQAIEARLRRGEVPVLRDASWRAYDQYLKANRVEQGVRSYSEVLSLLTRARFRAGWKPVRRN